MTVAEYWRNQDPPCPVGWLAERIHNWDRYRTQYPACLDREMTGAMVAHHQGKGKDAYQQAREWLKRKEE